MLKQGPIDLSLELLEASQILNLKLSLILDMVQPYFPKNIKLFLCGTLYYYTFGVTEIPSSR